MTKKILISSDNSIENIENRISKTHEMIGSGGFGYVYRLNPESKYVTKIALFDTGYQAFLLFCSENTNNIHLPVIKYVRYSFNNSIVVLEQLQELTEYEKSKFRKVRKKDDIIFKDKELESKYITDAFRQTIYSLFNFYKKYSCIAMDITKVNVMKRNDILVIIDPYVSKNCLL